MAGLFAGFECSLFFRIEFHWSSLGLGGDVNTVTTGYSYGVANTMMVPPANMLCI